MGLNQKLATATACAISIISHVGFSLAADIPGSEFRYGNWSGSCFTYDDTGAFSHCAVLANYLSGDTLIFSVNEDASVSVGIVNPALSLSVGESFPVSLYIDRRAPFHGRAHAESYQFARVTIQDFDRALDAIKRGHYLTIQGGGHVGEYKLTGTFGALNAAYEQALRYLSYGQPPAAPSGSVEKSANSTFLMQVATQVISEIGAQDFRYVDPKGEYDGESAIFWHYDQTPISGAVVLASANSEQDLIGTDAEDLAYFAEECNADFASSARNATVDDIPTRELKILCSDGEILSEKYLTKMYFPGSILYVLLRFDELEGEFDEANRQALKNNVTIRAASFVSTQ